MTSEAITPIAITTAAQELSEGRAIVVPAPSPLPYGVVATTSAAVNDAKGRSTDQATGMACADFASVRPYLELDEPTCRLAEWASRVRMLSLLLPVGDAVPAWVRPAVVDRRVAITLAWLPELRPLLEQFGHLYMSSANRTTRAVATTAAAADKEFGGSLLILDGDPLRDCEIRSGSSSIVQIDPHLRLQVFRGGINTDGHSDEQNYLDELIHEWQADRL